MPTFDNNHQQWQSWQPDNLLGETVETPLPTLDNTQSEAQLKAELARLRKQAEQQGFAQGQQQGQEEGRKQGYEAGLKEGREAGFTQGMEQARQEQQALLRQAELWVNNFTLALENLESLVPGRLVQFALTAVQQLYGNASMADNQALVSQIRTLMKQDVLLHGAFTLYVSPGELATVEQALGDTLRSMGWELHADPQLAAGGCRAVSPDVEVDASMETRWQALCQLAREELSQ
ncbi:flagellar assembly protein FliH [Enterobacter ludwigii]|uniref:flagellar assembly protein FliH n=1 Tax=Enterobacter TaxID=547 RepID=UPI000668BE7A|nr:flagellar assembly protein FliH [Enterobacter ludwigii]EKK5416473.1 flagellar assembly protein FliH [Enterobacter hormaechei]EKT9985955.1 flagellar assembly protein FliH [Enterobacter ludwigii]KZP57713.1 flagellar assembly protein FliH [Enterobacter ludwigii]HEM8022244.1 flagellar assembly protein FliH [Enterobacter ludwigii]